MRNIFVISDQHFGHNNILKFKSSTGELIRPEFQDIHDMNAKMIENHNSIVKPEDEVYFLGDVAFNQRVFHSVMPQLNGIKTLILGNHDHLNVVKDYYKYFFNRIHSYKSLKIGKAELLFTHFPLHETSFYYKEKSYNVHGHIHEKDSPGKRWFNASVERINYTPIHVEEILNIISKR